MLFIVRFEIKKSFIKRTNKQLSAEIIFNGNSFWFLSFQLIVKEVQIYSRISFIQKFFTTIKKLLLVQKTT